jgi:hypothetical protein
MNSRFHNERFKLEAYGSGYHRHLTLTYDNENTDDDYWSIAKITRCGRKRELGLVRYTGIRSRLFKTNRRGQVREINEIRQ